MNRIVVAFGLVVGLASAAFAGEFRVNGRTFTLPEGFSIELVAGPPMVDRPIVADFDERGRLYVADSSGSNEKVEKQLKERPHRVVRLEDTDGDGRFDKRTVFADRMMFPSGAMWRDGSLYVSAPPSIWKLTDTDDDGVADQRVEWHQGKTLTGCANDLHGPYNGPDGWIYWCKGAFARQTYERPGNSPFSSRAAHIFRCRADGTGIEPVMTGGMDNPVDVVFSPGGERIFTTTFLQHPGGGRRDGLIHAIYGGVWGKVHDVIDEHKQTGPDVMPVMTHLGPAAPAGLARAESSESGLRDSLFACQFNLRKVSRHELVADGSTFKTVDHEFLTAKDQDFHPTDVLEDADGTILVVDTGGWYKLCCPTSQLEKPDVLGAIYRVRRTDGPLLRRRVDPRGLDLDWTSPPLDELAKRLESHWPAVRRRAVESIALRGAVAIPTLARVVEAGSSAEAQRNAIWAATRIDGEAARMVVRSGLTANDPTVRQVALNAISLRRDRGSIAGVRKVLQGDFPQNRRLAAEILGRVGDSSVIPDLFRVLEGPADRALQHAITYALIELDDPAATAAGLADARPAVLRAALIALDQLGARLDPQKTAQDLSATDPGLREAASWIIGRHPEWGGALAELLRDRLRSGSLSETERSEVEGQLARFAKSPEIQSLLATTLLDASAPAADRRSALKAMARSGLKEVPSAWIDGLIRVLDGDDGSLISQAVATIRASTIKGGKVDDLSRRLLVVASRNGLPTEARVEALAAVPGGLTAVEPAMFAMLLEELKPVRPVASRLLAADVISRARLADDQLRMLADAVKQAGPLEVDRLLAAFESGRDEAVGLRLVDALRGSSAIGSLRVDMVRPRLEKYPPEVRRRAEALYGRLNADLAKQKARIDELLATLPAGEVRRGQAVFNGPKAACLTCHAVGYVGGRVGPDLSQVGAVRIDRDLLESIVYPSASFVRSYEPIVVATKDGRTLSGLVVKDASDEVVLQTAADQTARLNRDDIEEVRPGTVSLMPSGLDQQLTRQELADLIAFLKTRK